PRPLSLKGRGEKNKSPLCCSVVSVSSVVQAFSRFYPSPPAPLPQGVRGENQKPSVLLCGLCALCGSGFFPLLPLTPGPSPSRGEGRKQKHLCVSLWSLCPLWFEVFLALPLTTLKLFFD